MDSTNNPVELIPLFEFTPPTALSVKSLGKQLPIAPLWGFKPPAPPQAPESSQEAQVSTQETHVSIREAQVSTQEAQVSTQEVTNSTPVIINDGPDRTFGSPIITLFAGPKRVQFYVHTAMICDQSNWFLRKFGNLEEGEEQKLFIDLLDYNADVVNTFVSYIYIPKPPLLADKEDMSNLESDISMLAKLYLLGLRFEIQRLRDKANREIFEQLDQENDDIIQARDDMKFRNDLKMRVTTIREVYTQTTSLNDPLRKTLVTNMARHWECYRGMGGLKNNLDGTESDLGAFVGECPRFTKDLLRYLGNSTQGSFAPPKLGSAKKRKVGSGW